MIPKGRKLYDYIDKDFYRFANNMSIVSPYI